jgi:S-(hydroxymethyl)glutathione dehydrogenase/alcohol dehydrogenase
MSETTVGKPITCKAMVARSANEVFSLETITVDTPKAGEVRLRVIANIISQLDTLSGIADAINIFPTVLGDEAGCIVESVGEGVTSVNVHDHVIPTLIPQCRDPTCVVCQTSRTYPCPKIHSKLANGVMLDGTTRFKDINGKSIYHFTGCCSTMCEYTVVPEVCCAKMDPSDRLENACRFGYCRESTQQLLGEDWNTCKVEVDSAVAVFGLGALVSIRMYLCMFGRRAIARMLSYRYF